MDGDATDINDILCTFWKVRKGHRVKGQLVAIENREGVVDMDC